MSTKFEPGITKGLIGPGLCAWTVTGWIQGRGFWISISREGRTSRVWATSEGRIDWSTQEVV